MRTLLLVLAACGYRAADVRVEPEAEDVRAVELLDAKIDMAQAELAVLRLAAATAREEADDAIDATFGEDDAVEVAELELARARQERDRARELEDAQVDALQRARISGTREQVERAREGLAEARVAVAEREAEVRGAERILARAQRAGRPERQDVDPPAVQAAELAVARAAARLELLVAERALTVAELQRERARALQSSGVPTDLRSFDEGVREARARLDEAEVDAREVGVEPESP